VAIFSYEGQFTFGVNADYDSIPDVDVLTAGIEAGITELVKAAETT
jgi:diacylglycerol O-acyltransferase